MIKNGHKVMARVAAEYGITLQQLKGKSRVCPLPEARAMVCYILRNYKPKEVTEFMGSDRTAFYYRINKIEGLLSVYKSVRERHQRLLTNIQNDEN